MNLIIIVYLLLGIFCNGNSLSVPRKDPKYLFDSDQKDFTDISLIFSTDLFTNITNEHLQHDDGFKAAILHMQTKEWKDKLDVIKKKPEWIALKDYMEQFGFKMDMNCSFIDEAVVAKKPPEGTKMNLTNFLIDVEQNIPTSQLLDTIYRKFTSENKLETILKKFGTNKLKTILENFLAISEAKEMFYELENLGLYLQKVLSLIYRFFNWGEFKM